MKSGRELVEIISPYEELGSYRAVAALAGCDHKTVKRYVELAGELGQFAPPRRRARVTDDYRGLIAGKVVQTRGRITARRLLRLVRAAGYVDLGGLAALGACALPGRASEGVAVQPAAGRASRAGRDLHAGFKGWLRLGYAVRKGEGAIAVIAPMPVKVRDRTTGETVTFFKTVFAFDRGQVEPIEGVEQAPLMPPCEPLIGESHAHLIAPLRAFAESLGFTVSFETIDGPAGGWCDQKAKRIVGDADAPANARLRAVIHETIHGLGVGHAAYGRDRAEVIVDTAIFCPRERRFRSGTACSVGNGCHRRCSCCVGGSLCERSRATANLPRADWFRPVRHARGFEPPARGVPVGSRRACRCHMSGSRAPPNHPSHAVIAPCATAGPCDAARAMQL